MKGWDNAPIILVAWEETMTIGARAKKTIKFFEATLGL
jgi:hypothetical protein